jgi:hypothetical protein
MRETRDWEINLGHIKFETPITYPRRVTRVNGYVNLKFTREIWARRTKLGVFNMLLLKPGYTKTHS